MRRLLIAFPVAMTIAAAPGVAVASTVSVDPSSDTAVFRSGAGASDVTSDVTAFPNPPFRPALPFTDALQPLTAGAGCVAGTPVFCQASNEDVRLSSHDDRYVGRTFFRLSVAAGGGADDISAFTFEDLHVRGDGGADHIAASGGGNDVSGGGGADTITLVSNGGSTADGGSGDDDILGYAGGVQVTATGGFGSDLVASNRAFNDLSGGPGRDDLILLGVGEGTLSGGRGRDTLLVDSGIPVARTLAGGAGKDTIVAGPGADTVSADGGSDVIDVSGDGGVVDTVDCGFGRDVVYADPEDVVAGNCERRLAGPMPDNASVDAARTRFADAFGTLVG